MEASKDPLCLGRLQFQTLIQRRTATVFWNKALAFALIAEVLETRLQLMNQICMTSKKLLTPTESLTAFSIPWLKKTCAGWLHSGDCFVVACRQRHTYRWTQLFYGQAAPPLFKHSILPIKRVELICFSSQNGHFGLNCSQAKTFLYLFRSFHFSLAFPFVTKHVKSKHSFNLWKLWVDINSY